MRGLKRGENKEPNKTVKMPEKAEALAGQRCDRDRLLVVVHEVTTYFRRTVSRDRRCAQSWILGRCSRSLQRINRWNDFEKRFWPKWKAGINRPGIRIGLGARRLMSCATGRHSLSGTIRHASALNQFRHRHPLSPAVDRYLTFSAEFNPPMASPAAKLTSGISLNISNE
jgi:hypothetical protein